MFWGKSFIIITLIAVLTDFNIGEFPGKHPVQYLGYFISEFEKFAYKNSILRGAILLIILALTALFLGVGLQTMFFLVSYKFRFISLIIIGAIASSGLASKTLKEYVNRVLNTDDANKKRKYLSALVTRNTEYLTDEQVYSSLIETHSENLSDGVIAPLFYLILFGLPGIFFYKTVSTLDSMIGYKNEKYKNYGKISAKLDDILNFIPARITAFIIWRLSKNKVSWKQITEDAKNYSTSPNAGYPVAAAAYYLGVKLGGPVYYGEELINKAEIGIQKKKDFKKAAYRFVLLHTCMERLIISLLILTFIIMFVFA